MEQVDDKTLGKLREKAKSSLFFFAYFVLGFDDLTKHIHRPICRALQDYTKNTRMAIVLPRTWFKSTIGSVAYPIWRAINNPNIRILIAQNSMSNAKKKTNSIKAIFETNELLQVLFPEIMPKGKNPWSSECLTVNRRLAAPEGTFEPCGTGTAVTSRHYDLIIEDDTVAPDFDQMTSEIQQPTQIEIDKAIGFHKMCHPLLLHPTKAQIVIIGTRWAPKDLIGWIFENGPGYKIISRSALEKPGRIGEPATEDQGGVPIWDRFNSSVLEELKSDAGVGLFMFYMLYLNIPTAAINQVFKREYIHYYDKMPRDLLFCTSVDPAPTSEAATNTDSDYNVILTTGLNPKTGEIYIVHYNRERIDPGDVIDRIFSHYRAYKPLVVRVEGVAYQRTLCYWITRRQEQCGERFYIEEVKNARISKNARILGLQPWYAADKVYMKKEHTDLERELLSFDPTKKSGTGHDDVVDALSMQIDFWTKMCESAKQEEDELLINDPFSGSVILEELLDRPIKIKQYPYDIGNLSERTINVVPRLDYMYN